MLPAGLDVILDSADHRFFRRCLQLTKVTVATVEGTRWLQGETRARDLSQLRNEVDPEGNVEGVDSSLSLPGHQLEGRPGRGIQSDFTVSVVWVLYNVDKKPLNSKKNRGEAVWVSWRK